MNPFGSAALVAGCFTIAGCGLGAIEPEVFVRRFSKPGSQKFENSASDHMKVNQVLLKVELILKNLGCISPDTLPGNPMPDASGALDHPVLYKHTLDTPRDNDWLSSQDSSDDSAGMLAKSEENTKLAHKFKARRASFNSENIEENCESEPNLERTLKSQGSLPSTTEASSAKLTLEPENSTKTRISQLPDDALLHKNLVGLTLGTGSLTDNSRHQPNSPGSTGFRWWGVSRDSHSEDVEPISAFFMRKAYSEKLGPKKPAPPETSR